MFLAEKKTNYASLPSSSDTFFYISNIFFFWCPYIFFLSLKKIFYGSIFSRLLPIKPKYTTLPFKTNITKIQQNFSIDFFFSISKKKYMDENILSKKNS